MLQEKKPICICCEDRKATWPEEQPTFCTQRCAATYGFLRAKDTYSYCDNCEMWYDHYAYENCPNCMTDHFCSNCDDWRRVSIEQTCCPICNEELSSNEELSKCQNF